MDTASKKYQSRRQFPSNHGTESNIANDVDDGTLSQRAAGYLQAIQDSKLVSAVGIFLLICFLILFWTYAQRWPQLFISLQQSEQSARSLTYTIQHGQVCDASGRPIPVDAAIVGNVEHETLFSHHGLRAYRISGWVLDSASPQSILKILVFKNGRLIAVGRPYDRRPDVRPDIPQPHANEGFNLYVDARHGLLRKNRDDVRIFAEDPHGTVNELSYVGGHFFRH